MSDESDYKDYQDYLEYQKHVATPQQAPAKTEIPTVESIMAKDRARGGSLDKITTGIASGGVGEIAAPLGGLFSKAGQSLSNFFKPAAARTAAIDLVKNESALGPAVSDKIAEATEKFNQSQITPRINSQYAKATEQYVPFNAADYAGIHPEIDSRVGELAKLYGKEIPMSDALKLRAELNSNTLFKNAGAYGDTIAARSKALDAGNALRENISAVDPSIGQLSNELKDAYSLRKAAVGSAGKRPISTVEAPIGSDKASLLSQFDKAAGTDLRQFGQNISTAKARLGQSQGAWSPHSVSAVVNKAAGYIPRAYDSLGGMIQPAAEAVGNAMQSEPAQRAAQITLQSLLQGKRPEDR